MLFKLINTKSLQPIGFTLLKRCYAAKPGGVGVKSLGKKGGKIGAIVEKKIMPVETDPAKLVNYCCANYLTAENPIQLKPDNEYPEWLWKINTGKPKTLDELDPESKEYWKKIRTMSIKRNNLMKKLKKF